MALCAGFIALSGCTHMPSNHTDQAIDEDPLEPVNRIVFGFNKLVDNVLLRPITVAYRAIVPEPGREMVTNALVNLYTPVVFGNSVLQGDPYNSFATMWRFILNSTVGIGGAFDVASQAGLKNRPADFGQTMAMYGIGSGPYLVLPVIGPSNGRDATGRLVDAFMNPFNYVDEGFSYAMWGTGAIDARSNNMKLLDDIYRTSLDPYATFRSGYTQKRASDIRRAEAERAKSLEKAGF